MNQQERELLNTEQAADFLGLSPATLANFRCTGRHGIKFIKLGKSVRYRRSDLEKFMDSCTRTATE